MEPGVIPKRPMFLVLKIDKVFTECKQLYDFKAPVDNTQRQRVKWYKIRYLWQSTRAYFFDKSKEHHIMRGKKQVVPI